MKIIGVVLVMMCVMVGCVRVGPPKMTEAERAHLVAGYPTLYAHMQQLGCPRCHTTGQQLRVNRFTLPPPGENDTLAVQMLWDRLDTLHIEQSKLVRKPNGELGHGGGKILDPISRESWIEELMRWYRS